MRVSLANASSWSKFCTGARGPCGVASAGASGCAAGAGDGAVGEGGALHDQVDPGQQHVDARRRQLQAAVLGGDKGVFHAVRQLHHDVEADDGGGALDRMGRAHQRLGGGVVVGAAFHRQQAVGEDARLAVRFHAEQVRHRKCAEVVLVHAHRSNLASWWPISASSSTPMRISPFDITPVRNRSSPLLMVAAGAARAPCA
jgi:hypothetical protein